MKPTVRIDGEQQQQEEPPEQSKLLTVEMTRAKETKGTWVYHADDPGAPVPTIYIRKVAWSEPPITITLMVEAGDG